jgi:hypothetical protein
MAAGNRKEFFMRIDPGRSYAIIEVWPQFTRPPGVVAVAESTAHHSAMASVDAQGKGFFLPRNTKCGIN